MKIFRDNVFCGHTVATSLENSSVFHITTVSCFLPRSLAPVRRLPRGRPAVPVPADADH